LRASLSAACQVIAATAPESHYVLDEILGNATDLPIAEHAFWRWRTIWPSAA
jgi:hypothetical protein